MCVILENVSYNRTGSLNWANVALEFNCNAGIMTKLFPHSPGAPFAPSFCCRSLKLRQLQFTHALVILTRPYPHLPLFFLSLSLSDTVCESIARDTAQLIPYATS